MPVSTPMQLRELFNDFPFKSDVVPLAVQKLLNEPLDVLEDWSRAEKILQNASKILPERPEPLVALYKLYAYSNRFEESLALIHKTLNLVATLGGFTPRWEDIDSLNPGWKHNDENVRWFLYSMKALGFVAIRQGNIAEAHRILSRLTELDTEDLVGASVLLDVTSRLTDDDYDFVA